MKRKMNIDNQQIRSFEPIGNARITLGAAIQQVNWDIKLAKKTDIITFGLSEGVTTVPPNDLLTGVWATNISIIINGTHEIVRDFTLAEYINVVQNLEFKEADIISNGASLWKKFNPPLPEGTRVQINLTVNTLALATTTPAATAVYNALANAYDTNKPSGNVLTYYQRIPQFPTPVGVVANTEVQQDLGVEVKVVRFLILREFTAAVLSDTFTGRAELVADGNVIARLHETAMKKHYQLISDGLAVAAGYRMFKLPLGGWNASQARTLHIRLRAHTTVANGSWNGFQVLEKAFV
jgi:hypothetical protein